MKTDNELIAEFLGFTQKSYTPTSEKMWCDPKHGLPVGELKFDTSWDRLMPVVNKIGDMFYDPNLPVPFTVEFKWELEKVHLLLIGSHIQTVHKAVIQFIKWYNDQKK